MDGREQENKYGDNNTQTRGKCLLVWVLGFAIVKCLCGRWNGHPHWFRTILLFTARLFTCLYVTTYGMWTNIICIIYSRTRTYNIYKAIIYLCSLSRVMVVGFWIAIDFGKLLAVWIYSLKLFKVIGFFPWKRNSYLDHSHPIYVFSYMTSSSKLRRNHPS